MINQPLTLSWNKSYSFQSGALGVSWIKYLILIRLITMHTKTKGNLTKSSVLPTDIVVFRKCPWGNKGAQINYTGGEASDWAVVIYYI